MLVLLFSAARSTQIHNRRAADSARALESLRRSFRRVVGTSHDLRRDRKLVTCEPQRLEGCLVRNTTNLEDDPTRLDHGDPKLGCAFARAHSGLCRLLRHRLIGEYADPDFP